MRSTPKRPGIQVTPISSKIPTPSSADGPGVKNPTYKGKNPDPASRTISGEPDLDRFPITIQGKKVNPGNKGGGGGWGPGGRFGRGGWRSSGQNMKKNYFLARTAEQQEETHKKRVMQAAKKRAVKSRLAATKVGPNEKQSQLLGGE